MKIFMKILKILWILIVLCCAGFCATLMGAFSMDAPSTPMVWGALVFIIVFGVILLIGTFPIWLVRIGKKDEQSIALKKKLNGFALCSSLGICLIKSFFVRGYSISLFFCLYLVIYISGILVLKRRSKSN